MASRVLRLSTMSRPAWYVIVSAGMLLSDINPPKHEAPAPRPIQLRDQHDHGFSSPEPSSHASSFGQNSGLSGSSLGGGTTSTSFASLTDLKEVNAPNSPFQVESDDPAVSPSQTSFGNDSLQGIGGDLYPPEQEHLLDLGCSSDPSAQDQSADSGENNTAQADGTVKIGEKESKK